jgi:alpha-tubulin suppressor-like RCC1 family protein
MKTPQTLKIACLLCAVLLQAVSSGAQLTVTKITGGEYHSLFLKSDGSLWSMGTNQYGQLGDGTYNNTNRPEQIVATNVTAIAAGGSHSLFLKSDGSLWAMGDNQSGELGLHPNTGQAGRFHRF